MKINKICKLHLNKAGFTLVEILTAIFIVGIVAAYILPGITNGIRMIHEAGQKNAEILKAEGEAQISMSEKVVYQGVKIPIKFENKNEVKEVHGGLVVSEPIITFIPDLATISIEPYFLEEGYPLTSIEITGSDTHFSQNESNLKIIDSNKSEESNIYSNFSIDDEEAADFFLKTGLTNAESPYTVMVETPRDESLEVEEPEIVRAKLYVDLPQFVAVGEEGVTLVSSDGENWVKRTSGVSVNLYDVNSGDGKFIAAGDDGIINVLQDKQDWSQIDLGNKDIYAVKYNTASEEFVAVGEEGIILTSTDGINWNYIHHKPIYQKEVSEMNNQPAVYFNGLNTRMVSEEVPLTGNQDRSVFMIVLPTEDSNLLVEWGSPADDVQGGRWTFRMDSSDEGKLKLEMGQGAFIKSNLIPSNDTPSVVGTVLNGNRLKDHTIYLNGNSADINTPGVEYDNVDHQVNTVDDHDKINIGDSSWQTLPYKGYLAELLIYDRVLTAKEIDELNKYFAAKYDINGIYYVDEEPVSGQVPVNPVLWLKAESFSDLKDGEQVYNWVDESSIGNNFIFKGKSLFSSYYRGVNQGENRDDILIITGDSGLILRRDEGSWQLAKSDTNFKITGIDRNEEKYVAVGENGFILTSIDGEIWEKFDVTTGQTLNDVLWSNNIEKFVAVGDGGIILTSTDGGEWSQVDDLMIENNLNSITEFVNTGDQSMLVVVGDNVNDSVILTTVDGENWNTEISGIEKDLFGITVKSY